MISSRVWIWIGWVTVFLTATVLLRVPEERQPPAQRAVPSNEAPTVPSIDLMFEPTTPSSRRGGMPTATGSVPMPEIDLNLPTAGPPSRPTSGAPSSLEEAIGTAVAQVQSAGLRVSKIQLDVDAVVSLGA